ncbi:MAG: dethiobiotin synthase [Gammaproteobacteria bacterium]|nr:MAG: dethiobiotin synthase [Gammaproteobacteria bacterium]
MKNTTKRNGLFITGTDTDVGKTYIGSQVVSLLYGMKISVQPRKPIESGCGLLDGELQPADANHYYDAVEKNIPLTDICPFRFQPAISPQRAARLVKQPITIKELKNVCLKNSTSDDFLFVEGAGGFYSPLCEDGLNADLAKALQLPVLLIANDQLGCINHILLSAEAIRQKELELSAVILNSKNATHDDAMDNLDDLKNYFEIPIFLISHNELIKSNKPLVDFLISI